MSDKETHFHTLAKDSGNRLRGYILNAASAALGVYFLALTTATGQYSAMEKLMLVVGIFFFALTVWLRLLELHVDARRFFAVAKELEKPEEEQDWSRNEQLKQRRLMLIWGSYGSFGVAVVVSVFYLLARVMG